MFETEKLVLVISTFILGGASVLITIGINKFILSHFYFELNGNFINDLLYTTFKIGAVEELSKLTPFLIIYFFFRKELDEPIDYIVFICASALGFSAVENVMYFNTYGSNIILDRSIMSSVGHMFDSSIIAYGIMRYRFHPKHKSKLWQVFLFFILGSLAHGLYNFWLMHSGFLFPWGFLLVFVYFFFTISVFAEIINNSINNSPYFTYKKVIDNKVVAIQLYLYYGIVFIAQFIFMGIEFDFSYALSAVFITIITSGFVAFVSVVRLTRFKLIKGHWANIKLEFPFFIKFTDGSNFSGASVSHVVRPVLRVRGHAYNEIFLNKYYQEYFRLKPLNPRYSYLKKTRKAYIKEKFYYNNDQILYLVKLFYGDNNEKETEIIITPKIKGKLLTTKYKAIVGIYVYKGKGEFDITNVDKKTLGFQEWAVALDSKADKALEAFKMLEEGQ